MGGERNSDTCEALFRKQQPYLSIPKELQSAQAFSAMVENSQKEEANAEHSQRSRSMGGSGEGQEAAASGAAAASGGSYEEGYNEEEDGSEGRNVRSRRTPKRDLMSPGGWVSRDGGNASARLLQPTRVALRGLGQQCSLLLCLPFLPACSAWSASSSL